MAMGRRQDRERQEDLWVAHTQLAAAPGHPFYERLNAVLDAEGFDRFVEDRCAKFYARQFGRPSLAPGIYFRSLLIGYFEGIAAERGIAWRMADSLALRRFVGIALDEDTPDHSTISRTRRRIDLETHAAVFGWALVLLCHEVVFPQKGHWHRLLSKLLARRMRRVAIEWGLCRSGRTRAARVELGRQPGEW
jgi:transposase